MTSAADAVVVGAGPNGLVAANLLADAGWDVLVLEAQDEPGGAVRTAEGTAPGFRNDLYSAFYPLALPPAPLAALDLESHGLRWALGAIGPRGVLPRARFLVLPVRRLVEEEFGGESAGLLLAGNAMHTDVPPDAPPSGFLGWLLASLGQDVGFPSPVGGAGELTAALVRRFHGAGGRIECGRGSTASSSRAAAPSGSRSRAAPCEPARRCWLTSMPRSSTGGCSEPSICPPPRLPTSTGSSGAGRR